MPRHRGRKQYRTSARRNQAVSRRDWYQREEEKRWADLAGPVEISQLGSAEECGPRDQERPERQQDGAG